MKISLSNFKSIKRLDEFPIKPLTILSGVNSTGKSSLIQFLLLIKQTIELDSPNFQLAMKGNYYEVEQFKDLVYGKLPKRKISAAFTFDKSELIDLPSRIKAFDSLDYSCKTEFTYDVNEKDEPFISNFSIRYLIKDDQKSQGQFVTFYNTRGKVAGYSIQTNNELFVKNVWNKNTKIQNIYFGGIYPVSYETKEVFDAEGPGGKKIKDQRLVRHFTNLESIKDKIDSFFNQMSYIGPLRNEPKDSYIIRGRHNSVGSRGEHVAEILENYKNEKIEILKPTFGIEGVSFRKEVTTLLKAVSFWMCRIFGLGKTIKSVKNEDTYSIVITGHSNIASTVKHVGFGISQILPIIVEGLRLKPGSTLLLEQPEIHLHPRLQSMLFDFIHSLMLRGVCVVVETHSDDFITRVRRRVAEDKSSKLAQDINLTFIESIRGEILFRSIVIDEIGTFQYFPHDFMEQPNIETKAILKAQLKKRSKSK